MTNQAQQYLDAFTSGETGGGGFLDFLSNLNLGDLAATGLSAAALSDTMNRLSSIGQAAAEGAQRIGTEAQAASQFQPFTVTTGFGQVGATPEGGFTTTMSPQQQARQEAEERARLEQAQLATAVNMKLEQMKSEIATARQIDLLRYEHEKERARSELAMAHQINLLRAHQERERTR